MSIRAPHRADSRVVQAALPLGHADVRWDALPPTVKVEVLARWCELLRDVMRRAREDGVAGEATES